MISDEDLSLASEDSSDGSERPVENTYDKTIAAKHEYLGNDLEEVGGRTFHDEGSIIWLPILMELEVVLVPGQTLPFTAFSPATVSMFREIISKDKTFGVMCLNSLAQYGTTAEIYQYQADNDITGFRIKAKGRQRFKLLEQKREQTPGIISGRVLILPEIILVNPLQTSRFLSLDRYRKNTSLKWRIGCFDAAQTPWPLWIVKHYDAEFLVNQITEELKPLCTEYSSVLPKDPVDLSYWVAQCLPFDGENRVRLLSFNTAVERLQYALSLLSKCQKLYCVNCGNSIASRTDVFSMSIDGQGMYCNPGGYVHDVLTVYNGLGMTLTSDIPSTEYSWFPGYAWTIAKCSNCDSHIGWLFTALKIHLKPLEFWCLSKRSVTTHQKDLTLVTRTSNADRSLYSVQ
ncbi:hypothetical protein RUM44_011689 [Polyplax serrata]|uniref:Protein cereblon n=1 Tax=Polyplax serrata TaxID=468196 RepID=A0ABR1AQS1_POLSC